MERVVRRSAATPGLRPCKYCLRRVSELHGVEEILVDLLL